LDKLQNLLEFLSKQQPTFGKGIIWAAAIIPRGLPTLNLFLAYKNLNTARIASVEDAAILTTLAPYLQSPPPSFLAVHEWGNLASQR
jgi:hypothetical protein